ncbi:protein of unknown function [Pararobbsia alpina]
MPTLGNIVRDALTAIGVEAEDMSLRLLRNTDCRRRLLAVGQLAQRWAHVSHRQRVYGDRCLRMGIDVA